MIKIDVSATKKKKIELKHRTFLESRLEEYLVDLPTLQNKVDYSEADYKEYINTYIQYITGKPFEYKVAVYGFSYIVQSGNIQTVNASNLLKYEEVVKAYQLLVDEYKKMLLSADNIFISGPIIHQEFVDFLSKYAPSFNAMLKIDKILSTGKVKVRRRLSKTIIDILGYDNFTKRDIKTLGISTFDESYLNISSYIKFDPHGWSAYHYVFELGTLVCPYCNRSFIAPIITENGKCRADLDHFFTKSEHPMLSISIWNLIPSCNICNSSLKGDKSQNYKSFLHPFVEGVNDIIFEIKENKPNSNFMTLDDFELVISKAIGKKAKNNIKMFKIEELYQYHKDIAQKVINTRYLLNDCYVNSLVQDGLFGNDSDAKKFIISLQLDDQLAESEVLFKMKSDIFERQVKPHI